MPSPKEPRAKKKRPTQAQIFQLNKEVEKRILEYQENRPRFSHVQKELEKILGFEVTDHMLESARKTIGNWEPKTKDKPIPIRKEMLAASPRITLGEFMGMKANIEKLQNDFLGIKDQLDRQTAYIKKLFEELELEKPQPKPEEVNHVEFSSEAR